MGDIDSSSSEKPTIPPISQSRRRDQFQAAMEQILVKLKHNPGSITTEDARRLSENVEARDERSARIISAVESFAVANENLHEQDPRLGQAPHTSLLTVVHDLRAAVEISPSEVTLEVLRTTESIVSNMKKAIGHISVLHPELETKLQEEIAKIEPKILQGTVTKAEADRLHSLEVRAHGHTEKGGVTAAAQSVVAKRERQMSLSNSSSSNPESEKSRTENGESLMTPQEQSHRDKEANLSKVEDSMKPRIEQNTVTQADASLLQSREARAHGQIEKAGLAATAQSLVSKRRNASLSDRSNISLRASETDYERRKEQSQNENDPNLKISELTIGPKVHEENAENDSPGFLQSREHSVKGHGRENSQPLVDAGR